MNKSLGALLAICLAGLQFLAVLAVVSSSYVTSENALLQHARDLLRDIGINTIEHSKGFLGPAEGAAELAARLAQNRVIASDNQAQLERLLFQQLQLSPQFAGVYYGSEDGSFVYVMRSPDGPGPFRSKIITVSGAQRAVDLIWRDNDFNVVEERSDPADPYDPRTRLWYEEARAQLATIWTDPYIFFSSQQPGITLAAPVLNDRGGIRGVVGVDIEISAISGFLSRLNIGETGQALIMHRNGDVIAHPNPELLKATNDDGTLRFVNIREFDDPIARAAFARLLTGGEIVVSQETTAPFIYAGSRFVSTVMPAISDKLPWTIAVYAPENDFTGVIKRNRATNIWIAAIVAAVTGVVGLLLANYLNKPVRAFAIRSALIAQGEIDPADPAPKTYRELEKANEALVQQIVARRQTENEYGQTFDLASRGMAQMDPVTGMFSRVNTRFCKITGYSQAELAQMRFADMTLPDTQEALPSAESCPDEFAVNCELHLRRKDGGAIWVTVNSIMIRDSDGKALHAVVTLDDITQSKDKEGQIIRLNRDLSHLARGNTMGQMASGLAHELNQPLTAIAQNADTALLVLDQQPQSDSELRDILLEIERQSLRAGEIIHALRAFIRKDAGARTSFDLTELLEQSMRLVHAEAVEAGVIVETAIEPSLPAVEANRIQVAQVIVNLLRNAIEAMAPERDNERRVTVYARSGGKMVTLTVEDTGPGVDPGINLFAQFETSKPGGMGLGLSICRSIVEANGGLMWHEPASGRGARFIFTLPLNHVAQTQ
jgi:hypothetical protein